MSNQSKCFVGNDSSIGPNDVLLGRGNHLHNSGNEKFRSLVRSRSIEYWSCKDNVIKDNIARQIVDSVASQQGRFLRKVKKKSRVTDSSGAAACVSDSGVAVPTEHWEVADTETVLVKIKQTFRDFIASHKKRTGTSIHKTNPLPSLDGSLHMPQISILESLQNFSTLSTLPDSNNNPRVFSSPTTPTTDAYEMLFQNARAAQLGHLVQNAQHQLHHQNSQDQQLLSLFEQQRAILMTQLQQSSIGSGKETPITQTSQPQQQYLSPSNPHHQLSTQSVPAPLSQDLLRLSSTLPQLPQTLLNQQMYQSHQDMFPQRQNDQGQFPKLNNQQFQMIPCLDGSVLHQPQHTLANLNEPQQHLFSTMNRNTVPHLQNWSLQAFLQNDLSGVPQPVQDQNAAVSQQHHITERFDQYFKQGIPYSFNANNNNVNDVSSSRSINEFFPTSDPVQLPRELSYHHHPPIPQGATTDTVHQTALLYYEDKNDNNESDKKPPAL